MGKASSSKKVARAAGTGGGRTNRGRIPWVYYGALAAVVVLGTATVVQSRDARLTKVAASGQTPPIPNKDHWHTAYGFYLCDKFAPPITDTTDPHGIHTHGDGIIHVHPYDSSTGGKNAVLGAFTAAVHVTLNAGELRLPGGHDYRDGDKCGDKPGRVRVRVFTSPADKVGKDATIDPRKVPLNDQEVLTIAFAPAGAVLPHPPSVPNLAKLSDVTTTTAPPATGSATTPTSTTTPKSSTTVPGTTAPPTTSAATTTTTK
jgi:hypothetical protein